MSGDKHKMKQSTLPQLAELWQRAMEQATQEPTRKDELAVPELKHATGLNVKSGLQAGFTIHSVCNAHGSYCCDTHNLP